MIRRLPLIPTLIVLAAVAVMLRLGFWQMDRLHQKEALIARAEAALALSADAHWPLRQSEVADRLYRHTTLDCQEVVPLDPISGRDAQGRSGWVMRARCWFADGHGAVVVLGWAERPVPVAWSGGTVRGIIAPMGKDDARLVADGPIAGLAANARPDPHELPNNHLSYAVQWFLFAGVALLIYALALRKRLAAAPTPG